MQRKQSEISASFHLIRLNLRLSSSFIHITLALYVYIYIFVYLYSHRMFVRLIFIRKMPTEFESKKVRCARGIVIHCWSLF